MSSFSDMLVYLRKRENLSQKDLANILGLTRSSIGMYETGKREPDFETLEIIADFFNVNMDTLLGKSKDDVTFDDFTYAIHNETKELTESDKQILLSMARQLKNARKQNE